MSDYLLVRIQLERDAGIWRRFLLRQSATFLHLHHAIQDAAGWLDREAFVFRTLDLRTVLAGIPEPEDPLSLSDPDAELVRLDTYFQPPWRSRCAYLYDLEVGWRVTVELEGVERVQGVFLRRLLDGRGSFPGDRPDPALVTVSGGGAEFDLGAARRLFDL